MLTVDDYARIRRAYRDGMSIGEIARRFHHSRRKVREVLRGRRPAEGVFPASPALPPVGRVFGRYRSHPLGGRSGAAEAASYGDAGLRAAEGPGLRGRLRRGATPPGQASPASARDVHSAGARSGPADGSGLWADLRRFPRRPSGRFRVNPGVVTLKRPVCGGPADAAYGSHSGGDGSRLRVLRLRAARGVVGQPEDGGPGLVGRPGASAASALCPVGQSLRVRAAVLHAGPGQREAVRGEPRQDAPTPLVDAGAESERPRRVERVLAGMLPCGTPAEASWHRRHDR